jgi:beta-lactamase superfamily II metal-dependent hydrolase
MKSPSKPARTAKARRTPRTPRTKASVQRPAQHSSGAPVEEHAQAAAHDASGRRVTVRVYRQGLGDCILVRVKRPDHDDFKLMIDCGVVLGTPDAAKIMTRVMENLVSETQEKIDVLAITHEHWDHLSGFTQASDSFGKLGVGAVWVAWTEDPKDDLADQLRKELGAAKQKLTACANALHAVGDGATASALEDIALTPLGAAASSSTTKDAFDKVKARGNIRICRPSDAPFEIPDASARIYVLGPPHDPKMIRKINPSTANPETYGLLMTGKGALPLGVVVALDSRDDAAQGQDDAAPFHARVTIPLDAKGRPALFDKQADDGDNWRAIDKFFQDNYVAGADWRRIDGEWLGPATELALALQSYTNNTSLVLALELGELGKGDVLLFAADAQVGNWESWQTWTRETGDVKVTGPDLLKRTIFYKVGHHGSHNATLKEHGVEEMDGLKAGMIPVDEKEALKKRWGRMPLPDLIAALEKKAPGMILRTDHEPVNRPANVVIDDSYFEIML